MALFCLGEVAPVSVAACVRGELMVQGLSCCIWGRGRAGAAGAKAPLARPAPAECNNKERSRYYSVRRALYSFVALHLAEAANGEANIHARAMDGGGGSRGHVRVRLFFWSATTPCP